MKNRRRAGIIFFVPALMAIAYLAAFPGAVFAAEGRTDVTAQEDAVGMVTDAYDVDVIVQTDNSFLVTETISVDFLTDKHGIYRYIPVRGEVVQQYEGETVKMNARMKIEDVAVQATDRGGRRISAPVAQKKIGDNLVLTIGDAGYTLSGETTYTITYQARLYDDGIPEYDLIYWDALPTEWETPIRSSTVTFTIPGAGTDAGGAEFIAGKKGQAYTDRFGAQTVIDPSKDAVVITAVLKEPLAKGEGVTFLLRLPEGYFEGELSDAWMFRLLYAACGGVPLICFLLWLVFGRDKLLVRPVEFYPPEDLPPSEIGYLADGKVDDRDLLSLILWWASRGYLTIEETTKGRFTIYKRAKMPATARRYQRNLFNALFHNGVEARELGAPNASLASAMKESRKMLKNDYKEDVQKTLYERPSVIAQAAGLILLFVPVALFFVVMAATGRFGSSILSGDNTLIYKTMMAAFPLMFIIVIVGGIIGRTTGNRVVGKVLPMVAVIAFPFSGVLVPLVISLVNGAPSSLLIMLGSTVLSAVCVAYMRRRTPYYDGILDRVLGFKEFIKVAEAHRMKLLFDQDPQYFFHTLPYAWVFGLSRIWAGKFEGMIRQAPDWYQGYYGGDGFNTAVFASSVDRLGTASSRCFSPPAPESSDSGGGGGYSGGGGSSGGGFGGGGGGSW
ncbi:MAG: DUF2207 domain-containing protein [Clostridiales Family XIII bacterium]|jgi:uncharacterized membrane protein YgcG|nr:DUF2207 domain-containing protein [Clostridiales Family XIII bacterium]